ncbi:Nitrate transporter [Cercospora beticola]|uniref:Nitrate/nitrite transporter n=1 Tax=Cercospora beticola TaxID=122368 RepID=A0A2G5HJ01_CERBT|nr:Nitrate transporter [Cercospora beticola]PIA92183.1 Nitrate transporter [Cercospora beticola]WPB06063.1 hypothetical protein RHO25_010720 [Cercospora beticola]
MGFNASLMWRSPEVNPINHKARSIPVLNPIDQYGRVFFFSWFGFLVAFWSWYAFPPLLHDIIKADLNLTQAQVSNSNIVALCATLVVRLIAGPACDRFGPRKTFAGCLLIGAIPTFLAGTAYNVHQLYAVRFFIGILGGSFVPCQVWTTGFYDKNVVGTANALTAGLGNAGGGITYFLMPAIYESLVKDGLSGHVAWRVAFVVPGIVIVVVALALLLLCQDSPTGHWSTRLQATPTTKFEQPMIVNVPGTITPTPKTPASARSANIKDEKSQQSSRRPSHDIEAGAQFNLTAVNEIIQKPSLSQIARIALSPQTLVLGAAYFSTFGGELAINSILGTYYGKQFPDLNLQTSSNWAAMFGLMNVVFRPLGGVVSDYAYRYTNQSVWSKKILLHSYCIIAGAFLVAIGLTDQHSLGSLVCLVGIGMAFFLEGANGLNFSLVPHVFPQSNGVVSGFTGAAGNLGGVIFAIIFRYSGTDYGRAIWTIGVIIMSLNVATCWIKPVPRESEEAGK